MAIEAPSTKFAVDGPEQQTVATFVQLLAGAVKHHSLYPENHSIAKQHLNKIFTTLSSFLKDNQVLHLVIDKTSIIYDGSILYEGKNNDNDIAFLLGRDGVEWIEFLREIEQWEIQSLLKLINLNRRSDIDSDGNIATALWETDLPHIEYKTIDLTALDIPLLNFKSFQVAPESATTFDSTEEESDTSIQDDELSPPQDLEDTEEDASHDDRR